MKTKSLIYGGFLAAVLMVGAAGTAQAHPPYTHDHDGYWDEHHNHHPYIYRHHHHGYWDERNGVRIFIRVD